MSRLRFRSLLLLGVLTTLASVASADNPYQTEGISMYVGDGKFFETWDDTPFDREPYANSGFFASFSMGAMMLESPEPATIGADGIVRNAFYGTIGPMTDYNTMSTGGMYGDIPHGTQDTTFGYMEKDQGWFVRWFDFHGHEQSVVRSDVGVVFNDPQTLLLGFYDLDGDGIDDSFDGDLNFGRDGGPIDAGDLVQQGVVFGELQAKLRTDLWTVESNYVTRLPREICGAYWETFCGIRYFQFDESFNVEGIGGVLADSFWNTKVENRMVGPQVGIRWFRTDGRWTFSTEARGLVAANFQTVDQTYSFGSRLSQNVGRGTDPSTNGAQFFRSRFDRFVAREGVNSDHGMEIGGIVEVSSQATFALTRKLSLDLGLRGMCVEGLGRPSAMVNYNFPNMGINMDNAHQRIFMAGGYVGLVLNR